MMGRQSILETEPERVNKFLDLVRGGISPSNAGPECEIPNTTWKRWQQWGREAEAKLQEGYDLTDSEERYRTFCDSLQRARKRRVLRLEQSLIERLRNAETSSARDLLAVLSRIDPENWAEPEKRLKIEGRVTTGNRDDELERKITEYETAFAAVEAESPPYDGDPPGDGT